MVVPRNDLPEPRRHTTPEIILSLWIHFHTWYDGLGAFWVVVYFFQKYCPKQVPENDLERACVKA